MGILEKYREANAMGFFVGSVFSKMLNMDTSVGVILPQDSRYHRGLSPLPEGVTARERPRTLILLHGLTDNWSAWGYRSRVLSYAEEFDTAVIMPEVQRSFYQDMRDGEAYFSYVYDELPELAAALFNVSVEPEDLMVAGLSMGGYGALRCALTGPERYHAVGAFSSVTDLEAFTLDMPVRKETRGFERVVRGMFGEGRRAPEEALLVPLAKRAAAGSARTPILMTCGTEDELYPGCEAFAGVLEGLGWPVRFESWPGIHEWGFWDTSIRRFLECNVR